MSRTRPQPLILALMLTVLSGGVMFLSSVAVADQQPRLESEPIYATNPTVVIETTKGNIELELLSKFAPKHVANFLNLVEAEFYTGLIFHRVIPNFMIQAGGYDVGVKYKETGGISVPNESFNGLRNKRGSVAAARLDDPDSASTQFFINVRDNFYLDAKPGQPGYTVFARVIDGFDTVERIELTDTHLRKGMAGVPEQPITILSVTAQ
ncbi:MAG: peptidylprolyl isomerase [Pseudomonadales bacterium]|nr:peptidylprolyl isomerase [Pseudomonadales bacterium]